MADTTAGTAGTTAGISSKDYQIGDFVWYKAEGVKARGTPWENEWHIYEVWRVGKQTVSVWDSENHKVMFERLHADEIWPVYDDNVNSKVSEYQKLIDERKAEITRLITAQGYLIMK